MPRRHLGNSSRRVQVLVALQRLINALGPDCPASYGILQPLLQHCTDPNQVQRLPVRRSALYLINLDS